jgi:predicted nucleic acid-binding protein
MPAAPGARQDPTPKPEIDMIFDTDVMVWASRENLRAARAIDAVKDRAICVVSFMELLQGARSRLETRQIRESLRELRFRILPLSESIGAVATALIEQHALTHGIPVAEALIAATAIEAGGAVVYRQCQTLPADPRAFSGSFSAVTGDRSQISKINFGHPGFENKVLPRPLSSRVHAWAKTHATVQIERTSSHPLAYGGTKPRASSRLRVA